MQSEPVARIAAVYAVSSPITVENEEFNAPIRGVSRSKVIPATKSVHDAAGWHSVASNGNCVATLKAAGKLPNKPVTKDGFARTIPVKPVALKPGMKRVVKTKEGPVGHVLEITVNDKGQAISTTEGGHPQGVGRVVDPAVILGEVSL